MTLTKYVTVSLDHKTWFTMRDTPDEAIRDAKQDPTGMIRSVERWGYGENPVTRCHEKFYTSTVWIKPLPREEESCEGYLRDSNPGDNAAVTQRD